MKPYTLLEEYEADSSLSFALYERDGVKYYQVNSDPVASSKESHCEAEMGQMMAHPFRPARQPRFLVIGVGSGTFLNSIAEEIPQKKACFEVIDPNPKAFSWYKKHLIKGEVVLPRFEFETEEATDYLRSKSDVYHGIFIDPELWRSAKTGEDLTAKPFINSCVNSLKMGGLLGMVTERPDKIIEGRMERSGLEVTVERISAVPGGKRQRTIWLAKKGHYRKERS